LGVDIPFDAVELEILEDELTAPKPSHRGPDIPKDEFSFLE
jgi:hypothetical protein